MIKVFIENERGSKQKNLFHEKTLEYQKTVEVSRPYPYPYGFVIGTTSGDGDNLDCFVLTDQVIPSRTIVEVEPIGMFEQIEDNEEDNKILAVLPGETALIDDSVKNKFRDFTAHVFEHIPGKTIRIGRFLDKEAAETLIKKCLDK
ncbi:MAG: inorganic diphosphatase [bacterium]|nr:inorganic diphosphatase [bacterium]